MKIHDLINIDEFNNFKTLAKKKYSSHLQFRNYLWLDVYDVQGIYNFENITKSEDECRSLMKKWINYGLVEKEGYYQESVIKINY
jgi:hypothetical protein